MAKYKLGDYIKFKDIEQRNAIIAMLETVGMKHTWGKDELFLRLHIYKDGPNYLEIHGVIGLVCCNNTDEEVFQWARDMYDALVELKKEPQIKIGEHAVLFKDDGSIKVGCTSVDYDTLKAVYERATTKKDKQSKP